MHAMLDIETLGKGPGCVVLSIGAREFNVHGVGDRAFVTTVNLQSCIDIGLEIETETLLWWGQQPKFAELLKTPGLPIRHALNALSSWLAPGQLVWAKSPQFDCVILEAAYRACRIEIPWSYKNLRDLRTVMALAEGLGWSYPEQSEATLHDALMDATHQAGQACSALHHLMFGHG